MEDLRTPTVEQISSADAYRTRTGRYAPELQSNMTKSELHKLIIANRDRALGYTGDPETAQMLFEEVQYEIGEFARRFGSWYEEEREVTNGAREKLSLEEMISTGVTRNTSIDDYYTLAKAYIGCDIDKSLEQSEYIDLLEIREEIIQAKAYRRAVEAFSIDNGGALKTSDELRALIQEVVWRNGDGQISDDELMKLLKIDSE